MENFKIGDKVVVSGNSSYNDWITKVSHITPTGRVKVIGLDCYFSYNGNELNPIQYNSRFIRLAQQEDLIEFARLKIINDLKKIDWNEFGYKYLRDIKKFIEELKNQSSSDNK
jgi:hypothetical protein